MYDLNLFKCFLIQRCIDIVLFCGTGFEWAGMGCSHLPPVLNKTVVQVICMHSVIAMKFWFCDFGNFVCYVIDV